MFAKHQIDASLRPTLTAICNLNCYETENERFNYEKSLLALDINIKGAIYAIKFIVKHTIVKRLNFLEKKLHVRKEKLNILKLAVEGINCCFFFFCIYHYFLTLCPFDIYPRKQPTDMLNMCSRNVSFLRKSDVFWTKKFLL